MLRSSLGALVLAGGGWALHRHDVGARELHDLDAIGAGRPTVVQVHDPSCPLCRRLKAATASALEGFPGIDYRIADLTSDAGRDFGAHHRVGKVTLLLFDPRGRHVETVQGVQTPEHLASVFRGAFGVAATARAGALDS